MNSAETWMFAILSVLAVVCGVLCLIIKVNAVRMVLGALALAALIFAACIMGANVFDRSIYRDRLEATKSNVKRLRNEYRFYVLDRPWCYVSRIGTFDGGKHWAAYGQFGGIHDLKQSFLPGDMGKVLRNSKRCVFRPSGKYKDELARLEAEAEWFCQHYRFVLDTDARTGKMHRLYTWEWDDRRWSDWVVVGQKGEILGSAAELCPSMVEYNPDYNELIDRVREHGPLKLGAAIPALKKAGIIESTESYR